MRRLGLDIGTNSIGWCLIDYDAARPDGFQVRDIGVRIFSDGRDPKSGASLAVDRRAARAMRRRRDRYVGRRSAFLETLIEYGLMPGDTDEAKLIAEYDPYTLRAKALTDRLEPYEIGRALFHLNQRRGFLSNRKAERREKTGEDGKIASGAKELDQAMTLAGADTLGQFLAMRLAEGKDARVRIDSEAQAYDFYPQRGHLEYEFRRIWDVQAEHHPQLLTSSELGWDELAQKTKLGEDGWKPGHARDALYRILFYQRPLRQAKVGLCLFAGRYDIPRDEERLPKAHPLFQERRLYEEVNQLAITAPGEAPRPLTRDQRDALIHALRTKRKVAFTSLARTIKLQPGESFNKASETRTDLAGDEIYAALADKKRFGNRWPHFSTEQQWAILHALIEEENPETLHGLLTGRWPLDEAAARETARTPLPEGYGRLGAIATRKILEQLKADVIPYSMAVERCGWHHSDDRSDDVLDRLPYYGELLSREIPPGSFDPADDDKPELYWGKITNPTVHIGLRQLEKLINAIIAVHGRPDQIVVELARELNLSDEDKKKHEARIRRDTAAAIARGEKLEAEGLANNGANRVLLKQWEELNPANPLDRRCPYCAEPIGMRALFSGEADVDHIIPIRDHSTIVRVTRSSRTDIAIA